MQLIVENYIKKADPMEVQRLYQLYYDYNDDPWSTHERFREFRNRFNNIEPIDNDDHTTAIVSRCNVTGRILNKPERYSLVSMPWGNWKTYYVKTEPDNMSLNEAATHLYYEITYDGWDYER